MKSNLLKKRSLFLLYPFLVMLLFLHGNRAFGENAPVIKAGTVTNAVAGSSVTIPVSVNGFTDVGKFILTMQFDTTRIHFVSSVTHTSLAGMSVTFTPPSGNNIGKLVFSWTGASNVSLADGSELAKLTFTYLKGTGILEWRYIFGAVCEFDRYSGSTPVALNSSPGYLFFINGGISNRVAPVTQAPVINSIVAGILALPITVKGFTNIGAFTLYLEYDAGLLAYQNTFKANTTLGSSVQVGSIAGTGTKKLMVVQWYGNGITMEDGATLVTLDFNCLAKKDTSSNLTWIDSGPTCEYSDATADRLLDLPTGNFFINGKVTGPQIPTSIGNNTNIPGDNRLSMDNYPNPFQQHTTIRYGLPFTGKVTLVITGVLGNTLENLVSEVQSAGDYEVKFNSASHGTGILIARLTLENSDKTVFRTIKILNR